MNLSEKALHELRSILKREIDDKYSSRLDDEDLNELGNFFLELTHQAILRRIEIGRLKRSNPEFPLESR